MTRRPHHQQQRGTKKSRNTTVVVAVAASLPCVRMTPVSAWQQPTTTATTRLRGTLLHKTNVKPPFQDDKDSNVACTTGTRRKLPATRRSFLAASSSFVTGSCISFQQPAHASIQSDLAHLQNLGRRGGPRIVVDRDNDSSSDDGDSQSSSSSEDKVSSSSDDEDDDDDEESFEKAQKLWLDTL